MIQYALADSLGGIPPVIDFRVVDPSSEDIVVAAQCWIKTDTDHGWGNEVGVREYTLFAVNFQSTPNEALSTGLAYSQSAGLL